MKILHVLRAPVGGLFRHVIDLTREQAARGHAVGVVADSETGGEATEQVLAALTPTLSLGVSRVAMSRHVGFRDVQAVRHLAERLRSSGADIVHGHGAKGGAYARLAGGNAVRTYTPHGGSLHYSRTNPIGFAYLTAERLLLSRTDLALFESEYARKTFAERIGEPRGVVRIVHNGVRDDEFAPIAHQKDAADILFVGELRLLKGVDVLIDAIGLLKSEGKNVNTLIVGDGPDRALFQKRANSLGLSSQIQFAGAMPARAAFAKGRVLVVPSRAESLPYIVLEAAAAGMPIVATNVGGIPEIFGPDSDRLVPPENARALADAIAAMLGASDAGLAERLRTRISEKFTVLAMTSAVLEAYAEALTAKRAI